MKPRQPRQLRHEFASLFIVRIRSSKSTGLCLAATATLCLPMSMFPQRKHMLVGKQGAGELPTFTSPFDCEYTYKLKPVWEAYKDPKQIFVL